MYLVLVAIPLVVGFGLIYFSFAKEIEKDIENQLKEKALKEKYAKHFENEQQKQIVVNRKE